MRRSTVALLSYRRTLSIHLSMHVYAYGKLQRCQYAPPARETGNGHGDASCEFEAVECEPERGATASVSAAFVCNDRGSCHRRTKENPRCIPTGVNTAPACTALHRSVRDNFMDFSLFIFYFIFFVSEEINSSFYYYLR